MKNYKFTFRSELSQKITKKELKIMNHLQIIESLVNDIICLLTFDENTEIKQDEIINMQMLTYKNIMLEKIKSMDDIYLKYLKLDMSH